MQTITFTCEVITPMFLAGADGTTPELRPASIKGAMRFWWRAMNGDMGLEELKKKEAEIFGGSGDRQGRSNVLVRVQCDPFEPSYKEFNQVFYTYDGNTRRNQGKAFPTNPMYYLGFGPANWVKEEKRPMFIRPYIPVGTSFLIRISVKNELVSELLEVLKVVEQFGGLGSKSRNGFGCFSINNCAIDGVDRQLKSVSIARLAITKLSDFTAFSNKISLFETRKNDFSNWEEAFKNICMAYQYARENVEPWHEWNVRELIGLPIIVQNERDDQDNFLERHAKPYFMHISKVGTKYKGEILLLPYNYLSMNPEIHPDKFESNRADYHDALNRFNKLLQEKLTSVTQITL